MSAADAAQCSANDGTEAVIADVSLIGRRSPLIASAAGRGAALLGEWRVSEKWWVNLQHLWRINADLFTQQHQVGSVEGVEQK